MRTMQKLGLSVSRCSCGNLYVSWACQDWSRRSLQVVSAAPDLASSDKPPQRRPKTDRPRQASTAAPKDEWRAGKATDKSAKPAKASKDLQRLSKVMAAAGVAARRPSDEMITEGRVKVNGQVVHSQVLVDPETDVIHVDGKKIETSSIARKLYYFVVNKPKGYICSSLASSERQEGKRVIDLMQPWLDAWAKQPESKGQLPPRFFTVGRLDVATTGLIFVTNDGHWANKVIHPSSDITKEYLLLVNKAPSRVQLETMMRGVDIDGVRVAPEEVSTLEESVRLRVVVKEGKKHEVRLLAAAAELEVLSLKRVRVGGYRLPRTLRLGEYMSLSPSQLKTVADPRAQQAASNKMPSEQKAPPKMMSLGGIPDKDQLAALLEPGGKAAAAAAAARNGAPRHRRPRSNQSRDND